MSLFYRAIEATTSAPNTTYTDRLTVSASSGRSCHRPQSAIAMHQRPTRKATQSENCPSSVMEVSGFRHGLVAGAALGEHVGRADDPVPAQPSLYHDLDVVGVGEGVGYEAVIGHGVRLDA